MARPKGYEKTGGRQKGVGNKKPPMKALRLSLAELDFDLGKALLNLFNETEDANIKLNLLKLIAQYTQSIPKEEPAPPPSMETDEDAAGLESLSTENLLALTKK